MTSSLTLLNEMETGGLTESRRHDANNSEPFLFEPSVFCTYHQILFQNDPNNPDKMTESVDLLLYGERTVTCTLWQPKVVVYFIDAESLYDVDVCCCSWEEQRSCSGRLTLTAFFLVALFSCLVTGHGRGFLPAGHLAPGLVSASKTVQNSLLTQCSLLILLPSVALVSCWC